MNYQLFYDVFGLNIPVWLLALAPLFISFFTSMGGISGAFILLPFQVSVLGITSPSVSSTNHLFNVIAIPGGVIRYIREGRMFWQLAWIILIGTLPGVFVGTLFRLHFLSNPLYFKAFVGCVLLYIGARLAWGIVSNRKSSASTESRFRQIAFNNKNITDRTAQILPKVIIKEITLKRMEYEFCDEKYIVPVMPIFLLSLIIGLIGGAYGIGGGAIMAPLLVAIYRLPIYTTAGATLFGTFITSITGVAFYQILSPYYPSLSVSPDWLLGICLGVGGLLGTYLGARFQKYMPANLIKILLAGAILFLAVKYILTLVF
ncbi:MAG: uncharacterized protein QG635_316 [Bacteroidota bacterium]|nr:uncharacterized protein [Bacteroidota bacterium]